MYLTNYKSVALPLPELIGGIQKLGLSLSTPTQGDAIGGRGWYRSKERWRVPRGSPYILFLYQHSFARNFRLHFWVGVANPQSWGKGGRMGSGIIPFDRAFVRSYRPSIVTFPLSLRVSEILQLLFSRTPLFPTPPLVSPKCPRVLLGVRRSPYGCKERMCWADCPCSEFPRFPTYVITNHQRHRQTDGQTDDMRSQDRALH